MGKLKKNFYAVKKGRVPGIYTGWLECKKQVTGYPGAIYKGFPRRSEAEAFLGQGTTESNNKNNTEAENLEEVLEQFHAFDTICYTDGSCLRNPGPCGAAAVVCFPGGLTMECKLPLGRGTNNIAELYAIHLGNEIVKEYSHLVPDDGSVRILTDSKYTKGVLAEGWEAKKNTELIKWIRDELSGMWKKHRITFHWVKAHAGCKGNERADRLANEASQQSRLDSSINMDLSGPQSQMLKIVESPISTDGKPRKRNSSEVNLPNPPRKKPVFGCKVTRAPRDGNPLLRDFEYETAFAPIVSPISPIGNAIRAQKMRRAHPLLYLPRMPQTRIPVPVRENIPVTVPVPFRSGSISFDKICMHFNSGICPNSYTNCSLRHICSFCRLPDQMHPVTLCPNRHEPDLPDFTEPRRPTYEIPSQSERPVETSLRESPSKPELHPHPERDFRKTLPLFPTPTRRAPNRPTKPADTPYLGQVFSSSMATNPISTLTSPLLDKRPANFPPAPSPAEPSLKEMVWSMIRAKNGTSTGEIRQAIGEETDRILARSLNERIIYRRDNSDVYFWTR